MSDVSGVTPPPEQDPVAQVTDSASTQAMMATTIPAGGTVSQLPQPLVDAIMQCIAQQVCQDSQDSTDRIKAILQEQEENEKG